jgi:hypothetical protein
MLISPVNVMPIDAILRIDSRADSGVALFKLSGADGMMRGPLIWPESIRFFYSRTGSAAPPPDSNVV